MKISTMRAEVTVDNKAKILAMCITLLNTIWIGDVKSILRSLVAYYKVKL